MAAIDYARLRARCRARGCSSSRTARRSSTQSLATFRHALRDHAFGELWVGGAAADATSSTSSPRSRACTRPVCATSTRDHFDVVIVDEFHHAAAPSYRALLDHVAPVELLGLTATPGAQRRPAAAALVRRSHRRRAAALGRHRPAPAVAVRLLRHPRRARPARHPWRRGRGYDVEGLTNLLTANDAWARQVLKQLVDACRRPARMRALGFCVSVEHARFMARVFNEAGIRATAVWADSPRRRAAAPRSTTSPRGRVNVRLLGRPLQRRR